MYKCEGCGTLSKRKICDRCFRIRNYNEYEKVSLNDCDIDKLLDDINKDDLTVLVIDLLNIPKTIDKIKNKLNSNVILALTKFDLMPTNNELRYIKYFTSLGIDFIDAFCISSKNNHNIDELYNSIKKNYNKHNVYFVGYTNAGKSSLINKLIYNYSDIDMQITTSPMPNTTLSNINIKINDINLIDTPGLIYGKKTDIANSILKKLHKSKKIKPITYQIKRKQYILIENIIELEIEDNDIIIYVPSNLNVERFYKESNFLDNLNYDDIKVNKVSDIVIPEIGFIKVMKKGNVKIKTECEVFLRKNLI